MKKSELVKLIREELQGYSPQIGKTKGLTPATLNKILKKIASGDDYEPEGEVDEKAYRDDRSDVSEWPMGALIQYIDKIIAHLKSVNRRKYKQVISSLEDTQTILFDMDWHSEKNNLVPEGEVEEGDGLWANIRAKRARGEKPAHKNSKAHKDAVKAGKKINKGK